MTIRLPVIPPLYLDCLALRSYCYLLGFQEHTFSSKHLVSTEGPEKKQDSKVNFSVPQMENVCHSGIICTVNQLALSISI